MRNEMIRHLSERGEEFVDEWNSIVELKKRAKSQEFILPTHAPEMIEIVDSKRVYGN